MKITIIGGLAGLAIAAVTASSAVANVSTTGAVGQFTNGHSVVSQGSVVSSAAPRVVRSMTVGGAVTLTPPQLARQRAAALQANVGLTHSPSATSYYTSGNWAGMETSTTTRNFFQGIAGQWTVPSVQATVANHYGCTWVGVDGDGSSSLIQAGTEEDSYNGKPRYYAWLELLPATQSIIVNTQTGAPMPVAPGDVIWSYVYRTVNTNKWTIYLQDTTRNWSLTYSTTYNTPGISAEWIHEVTKVSGVIGTPPRFSTTTFTNLEVLENNTWYYTGLTAANEVFMIQGSTIWARPSAPAGSNPQRFSVQYG